MKEWREKERQGETETGLIVVYVFPT